MSDSGPEATGWECPHCGGGLATPDGGGGREEACPHCGGLIDWEAGADGDGAVPEWAAEGPGVEAGLTLAGLAAGFRGTPRRVRVSWGYGVSLWLGAMVLLAIPVVYAGLVVFVGATLVGLAGDWLAWVRGAKGGAMAAGLRTAGFLAGLGLGLFVLGCLVRPFFVRPAERVSRLALHPVSEPLLLSFIRMLCEAMGVPEPARVEVDCRMNASVGWRRRGRGRFSNEWVLTLGLPLVAGLRVTEFTGILVHELGHLGQGWAMRACHVIRGMSEWLEVAAGRARSSEDWERWAAESSGMVHRVTVAVLRVGVWMSEMVVGVLRLLGMTVVRQLRRQMERNADRLQIEWVGSEAYEATFRRLCVLEEVRRGVYRDLHRLRTVQGEWPEDFPGEVVSRAETVDEETAERWWVRTLEREADFLEVHPSAGLRLEMARSMAAPGCFRCDGEARALFSNFGVLAKQVTALHYREDLGMVPRFGPTEGGAGSRMRGV